MKNSELTLCSTAQTSQRKRDRKKIKQICLSVPAIQLESLREKFGRFIFSEDQSQTSQQSSFERSSDLVYFSAEEDAKESEFDQAILKRMSERSKPSSSKSKVPKLSSFGSENEKTVAQKVHRNSKITKAATTNIETSAKNSIRKETQIGSYVFSDSSSDGTFVEFSKDHRPSKTISALQNEEKYLLKKFLKQMVESEPKPTSEISESDQSKAMAMQNTASNPTLAKVIKNEIIDISPVFSPIHNANHSMPEKEVESEKSTSVGTESDQSKAMAMQNTASNPTLAKVIKNEIIDISPVFSPIHNANHSMPEKEVESEKSTSVGTGHLELLVKNFIEWSFLPHNDHRHICVSNSYSIRGYSFHIEINSDPLGGNPGQSNDNFAPFYRKCGILLVCDSGFPDKTLRLASNFVITLKASNSTFNDHIFNCTTVFSTHNKTGGSLAISEFIANPDNGLLLSDGSLCITIDVEFISNKELTLKLTQGKMSE